MSRPTDYTPEKGDAICARLALGDSLRKVCQAEDMPEYSTVFKWLRVHEEFVNNYARAREQQAEHFADELVEIADSVDGDAQRDRLRVDTRKWIASKLKPKKFGDVTKHEHTGADGGPLKSVTSLEVKLVRPDSGDT